jgi:autotransporter-associated beta strand protein
LAGTANLVKTGAGTLVLTNTNTYTGTTTINGGTVSISSDANLGSAPSAFNSVSLILNNGTLNGTSTFTLNANRGINLAGPGAISVDGSTVLTYNGVLAGSGNFEKQGSGTLVLGGANTLAGIATIAAGTLDVKGTASVVSGLVVSSGATYIVDQVDTLNTVTGSGTVVLNSGLTVGSGNVDFSFDGQFAGSGTLTKVGSGSMTLNGSSTYSGNTVLNASQLVLGNANALGSSALISTNGVLNLASGVTLSGLTINGPITISSDIRTIGAQTYNGNVVIAGTVSLSTSNASITFNGLIDSATSKANSLTVDAGAGVVTIGNSVGSIAPLASFVVSGSTINLLADVLTAQQQIYNGSVVIGSNGSDGFLYSQFLSETRPSLTFKIFDTLHTRTLISMDPLVEFNGTVNPASAGQYSLLVAAIYPGFVNGDLTKMPTVSFNGLVGNVTPFYSMNVQTLQAGDLFALTPSTGVINVTGGVETIANQNYSTAQVALTPNALTNNVTFKSTQGAGGNINFDLSKIDGKFDMTGRTSVVIDARTNFTGTGIDLLGVRFPVAEAEAAAAAAAAASGGNLANTSKYEIQTSLVHKDPELGDVVVRMDDDVYDPIRDQESLLENGPSGVSDKCNGTSGSSTCGAAK